MIRFLRLLLGPSTRPFEAGAGLTAASAVVTTALLVAACTAGPDRGSLVRAPAGAAPRLVESRTPLECVSYARARTGIALRGDAWTWWEQAAGRYHRSDRPEVGAVLVYKRKGRSRGHLAVVTRVLDDRTVLASHANWLNRGRIHENTPIRDVSAAGDWSAVQTWYIPGETWGRGVYATYGFIYPDGLRSAER